MVDFTICLGLGTSLFQTLSARQDLRPAISQALPAWMFSEGSRRVVIYRRLYLESARPSSESRLTRSRPVRSR